ncbi:hypothetical protein J3D65DRAFT_606020 [Phyllosticta citribraziliensis]|uniref:FHA domain-containing protein n=1 Tax=Phyllosticta citribraziliensis TaxID=989973 RepID=A0ABR1L9Z0_9PEZI
MPPKKDKAEVGVGKMKPEGRTMHLSELLLVFYHREATWEELHEFLNEFVRGKLESRHGTPTWRENQCHHGSSHPYGQALILLDGQKSQKSDGELESLPHYFFDPCMTFGAAESKKGPGYRVSSLVNSARDWLETKKERTVNQAMVESSGKLAEEFERERGKETFTDPSTLEDQMGPGRPKVESETPLLRKRKWETPQRPDSNSEQLKPALKHGSAIGGSHTAAPEPASNKSKGGDLQGGRNVDLDAIGSLVKSSSEEDGQALQGMIRQVGFEDAPKKAPLGSGTTTRENTPESGSPARNRLFNQVIDASTPDVKTFGPNSSKELFEAHASTTGYLSSFQGERATTDARKMPPSTKLRVHTLAVLANAKDPIELRKWVLWLIRDNKAYVLHLCGCGVKGEYDTGDGCVQPSHLRIGSKEDNDQHRYFHMTLRSLNPGKRASFLDLKRDSSVGPMREVF